MLTNPSNVTGLNIQMAGSFKGIQLYYTSSGSSYTNIVVQNNTFADIHTPYRARSIGANTVSQCGGNCVFLGAANMHITDSIFLRDTPEQTFPLRDH